MLDPSLRAVVCMDFLLVASMDISLGNIKAYQKLLGVVSVITRIYITSNYKYYCSRLPRLTMLQILLS